MPEHDDEQFRASLRRAVTTATPADDAWPTIARRVRRQRAGRAVARAGIPALCAVVLLGGAFALSRRGDGSGGVGTEPSTTPGTVSVAQAPSTTASVPATTSTISVTVTEPGPIVTPPVTTVPATTVPAGPSVPSLSSGGTTPAWVDLGSMTAQGSTLDLAAFVDLPGLEACVQARSKGATDGPDWCGPAGHFGVTLLDDQLWVVGLATGEGRLTIETTGGSVTVQPPMLLGWYPWAVRLPAGTELVRVGDGVSAAGCPYRPIIATIRASGGVVDVPFPVSVEKCAGGVAGVGLGGSLALRQGAVAILEQVDGRFELINLGGDLCNRDPALQTSARELAACDKIGWP